MFFDEIKNKIIRRFRCVFRALDEAKSTVPRTVHSS